MINKYIFSSTSYTQHQAGKFSVFLFKVENITVLILTHRYPDLHKIKRDNKAKITDKKADINIPRVRWMLFLNLI